jgi:hypothetical protein
MRTYAENGGNMRSLSAVTGHLLAAIVVLFEIGWIVAHITGMPDYKLVVAVAAVNILAWNHFRWWRLGKKIDGRDLRDTVNHTVVSNYMVMLLFLVLLDFSR